MTIVFKCTAVVCGSTVACGLLLAHCGRAVDALAGRFGMNRYAVAGFWSVLQPAFDAPTIQPDGPAWKVANAAFAVTGGFVFGGQLAFVSSVSVGKVVAAYVICACRRGSGNPVGDAFHERMYARWRCLALS